VGCRNLFCGYLLRGEIGAGAISSQNAQASWSAGGARRDFVVMEKNVTFWICCSGLFTVLTKLRTVNRRFLAVTTPLSQSLSWRRPLTKKPEDSVYEIWGGGRGVLNCHTAFGSFYSCYKSVCFTFCLETLSEFLCLVP